MNAADSQHIDADILALLALGEDPVDIAAANHVRECTECARELSELRATVAVGRSTLGIEPLLDPPASVWMGISDELGLSNAAEVGSVGRSAQAREASVDPVDIRSRRRGSGSADGPRRRTWVPILAAAAAMVVLVVGGGFWLQSLQTPRVLAQAELDAFPAWSGASGDAVLEVDDDGDFSVVVSLTDAPKSSDSFREVWLINGDATALVSLGVLSESTGTFAVPRGIDLTEYSQVDISQEPLNGDPTHSGDSIVRGTLNI